MSNETLSKLLADAYDYADLEQLYHHLYDAPSALVDAPTAVMRRALTLRAVADYEMACRVAKEACNDAS